MRTSTTRAVFGSILDGLTPEAEQEVFRAVVVKNSVPVGNRFQTSQRPTDLIFHDLSVLINPEVRSDFLHEVAVLGTGDVANRNRRATSPLERRRAN